MSTLELALQQWAKNKEPGSIMLQAEHITERINWLTKLIRQSKQAMTTAQELVAVQLATEGSRIIELEKAITTAKAEYDLCLQYLNQKPKFTPPKGEDKPSSTPPPPKSKQR